MATHTFRFDYTLAVYGKRRSAAKTFKTFCWSRAAQLLGEHCSKKWAAKPLVIINNVSKDGVLMNPDLFPQMQRFLDESIHRAYLAS